uniref:START domain-containing protein n=1 Tax=Euplotes harpa TaxID=151035 RepID=A0A7S3N926_9SPIT|mmetsp:Transcript_24779/g.28475  ORF Transcript_24779/g.28475 Transcript_24779/m.28475 type:complete len:202 (+) Transcript_24779:347-952(+)
MLESEHDTADFHEVFSDHDKHNMKIYRKDSNSDEQPVFRLTMEVEGVAPFQIASLFSDENIKEEPDWCENCISCECIFEDKHCNIYRTLIDCEFLSNREFIDRKYWKHDPLTDSYYVMFVSADDHPDVMRDYPENDNVVRGKNYQSSYILRPLDDGRTGTKFLLINQSEFGGSVPNWIVKRFTTKPLSKFMMEIINRAKLV